MITYASYLPRKADVVGNAFSTCIINGLYSFIAGVAVFGTIGYMAMKKGVSFSDANDDGPA